MFKFNKGLYTSADDGSDQDAGGDSASVSEEATKEESSETKSESKPEVKVEAKTEGKAEATDDKSKSGVSDEMAALIRDVMKQKERAKAAQEDKQKTAAELESLKGVLGDMSLDDVSGLVNKAKDEERQRLEAKGEYEQIVTQLKEQHTSEVTTLKSTIEELRGTLNQTASTVEELSVGRSFSDSKFIKDRSTLPPSIARKEFGEYFEIENGEVVAYNAPRGKEDRSRMVDAEGNKKSFESAIQELYEQHPDKQSLLKTTQKPGSGSSTDSSESVVTKSQSKGPELTGVDKIKAGLQQRAKAS